MIRSATGTKFLLMHCIVIIYTAGIVQVHVHILTVS
jgi:hypothetical protein